MTLADPPVSGTPLQGLTASQYQRLSQLLDESIDLSTEERAEWLGLLDGSEPGWAAFLRNMFGSQDRDRQKVWRYGALLAREAGPWLAMNPPWSADCSVLIACFRSWGMAMFGLRSAPNTEPQSFSDYASAAERERIEDWPDGAWRDWRYRRSSLARLLASQGKMHQVVSA